MSNVIPDYLKHYVLDMANAKGETVCQGHADVCAIRGHAYWRVNGVDREFCARCGDRTCNCGFCIPLGHGERALSA